MSLISRIFVVLLLVWVSSSPAGLAQTVVNEPFEPEATDSFENLEEAHAAYLRNRAFQLERPDDPPEPINLPKPPGWLSALIDFLALFAPLFSIAFYVIVAGIILGVLYFVATEVLRLRFGTPSFNREADEHVIETYKVDANMARQLLEEADHLAQQGRYAEAVHLLLFRSIEDIQHRVEGGVPRSLTSREIGDMRHLPDAARLALKPIIRIVERSFFGAQTVDSHSWDSARAHYQEFAFGKEWATL